MINLIMENGSYNRISGRKTLILVIALIALILILTIYSVFLVFRRSNVLTKSTSIDKPIEVQTVKTTPNELPRIQKDPNGIPTRLGD